MRAILSPKQKEIVVHPAPDRDVRAGLKVIMARSFKPKEGVEPIFFTDLHQGQSSYAVAPEMIGYIQKVEICV